MPTPSCSRIARFHEPQHFDFLEDVGKWSCNICMSPIPSRRKGMSAQIAMKHEGSREHKQTIHDLAIWNPQPDVDAWINGADYCELYEDKVAERMVHVDSLKDLVPFWRHQVEAANRGVDLRFEDFLDSLVEARKDGLTWNGTMPDWALEPMEEDRSSQTGQALRSEDSNDEYGSRRDGHFGLDSNNPRKARKAEDANKQGYLFVEEVAGVLSLDAQRKELLHAFYKIPTTEKIERIQGLINFLKTTQ